MFHPATLPNAARRAPIPANQLKVPKPHHTLRRSPRDLGRSPRSPWLDRFRPRLAPPAPRDRTCSTRPDRLDRPGLPADRLGPSVGRGRSTRFDRPAQSGQLGSTGWAWLGQARPSRSSSLGAHPGHSAWPGSAESDSTRLDPIRSVGPLGPLGVARSARRSPARPYLQGPPARPAPLGSTGRAWLAPVDSTRLGPSSLALSARHSAWLDRPAQSDPTRPSSLSRPARAIRLALHQAQSDSARAAGLDEWGPPGAT
jgi:hypothetical protein